MRHRAPDKQGLTSRRGEGSGVRALPIVLLLLLIVSACAGPSPLPPGRALMDEAIRSYLGTPYRYGGTSRGGIDCSGLVMRVFERVGVRVPRSTWEQRETGERIDPRELRFGDVLFFASPSGGSGDKSLHAGIFMGEGRFVHASKTRGVIVDDFFNPYWQALFLEGRRFLKEPVHGLQES